MNRFELVNFKGGIYRLLASNYVCSVARMDSVCVHEWHRRLAHINLSDVRNIAAKMEICLGKCNCSDICDPCMRGKMSKLPFPKFSENEKEVLDCIVSDLCGPMQTETLGKAQYFMTFIDVHSGYAEVEFLRKKDETAGKTIEFLERMKTQLGRKCKKFRCDGGGEYQCYKLQNYLKKEGIISQCTVARNPQQNGKAERKNRTLMEGARTLLFGAGLSNKFWGEAVHNINTTLNMIPKDDVNKSPYEIIFGKAPWFEFHEFGCEVYVKIPDETRRKLDAKSELMRYLSPDKRSKGYRVVESRGIVKISRDLKFVTKFPKSDGVIIDVSNEENSSVCDENLENCKEETESEHSSVEDENFFETPKIQVLTKEDEQKCLSDVETPRSFSELDNSQKILETPRAKRQTKVPRRFGFDDFVMSSIRNEDEPKNFQEAMSSKYNTEWKKAVDEEIQSIESNNTWTLTNLPEDRKTIGSKWVFKVKRNEKGEIVRYKARLVAQGFTQKYGVDYDEVFAPVARSATLRLLLSIAGKENFSVKHLDVKTAFLNGNIDEEIYMRPPQGFEMPGKVYKLNKSLYGLKQAARAWNDKFNETLLEIGFQQNDTDKCLYVLSELESKCYLLVHVDDILLASKNEKLIQSILAGGISSEGIFLVL
jgi:hypothetical protein